LGVLQLVAGRQSPAVVDGGGQQQPKASPFEQKEPDYLLWGAASARVLLVRAHLLVAYFN
jgi:hypothetical protein